MKTKVRKIISFILAAGIMSCVPFAACSVTSERYDGQNNGTINGGENGGSTAIYDIRVTEVQQTA